MFFTCLWYGNRKKKTNDHGKTAKGPDIALPRKVKPGYRGSDYRLRNLKIVIDRVALAEQGDNALGSICPCVCPSACTLTAKPFDLRLNFAECSKEQQLLLPVYGVGLCVCNQWVYADNLVDAVDRLLIFYSI